MVGLVLSGVTTFPLPSELRILCSWLGDPSSQASALAGWIARVRDGLDLAESRFPFLFYGFDWLGFGHLVIAAVFVGPFRDPVRNVWVIRWGMFACLAVIPLALICGSIRGIPFGWRLIDCSFGLVGIVPLILCDRWVREMEAEGK